MYVCMHACMNVCMYVLFFLVYIYFKKKQTMFMDMEIVVWFIIFINLCFASEGYASPVTGRIDKTYILHGDVVRLCKKNV